MSKVIIGSVIAGVVVMAVLLVARSTKPAESIVGTQYSNQGEQHISVGASHKSYNSVPASSGPHYTEPAGPVDWGIYNKEVQPEVYLHNLEHGGIVVTYDPAKLDADGLKQLQDLLMPQDTAANFRPSRFILFPSSKPGSTVALAAWQYTLKLDRLDKTSITKFYNQHANKAPENGAEPTNAPAYQSS